MQTYHVKLESSVSTSFRCTLAANSLDIDQKKKSVHELSINADIHAPFSVGLIIGSSGSGKTSLAKQIFGDDCFVSPMKGDLPIIDQFPAHLSYDDCASILAGVGLTSVPCWIRPVYTLSNGQRARAEAALACASHDLVVLDEWTSVVDRTVAKVMSHCVQKFVRRSSKQIVLLSCHSDVIEWLQPDWVIDCNRAEFHRRSLHLDRSERLLFTVREIDRTTWRYFSKYHYLSERLPGGKLYLFGLFHGVDQIGFICYASYMPRRRGQPIVYHFNRLVIHPDYAGMGLGIRLVNETAHLMRGHGFRVLGKFSSVPIYKSMSRDSNWYLRKVERLIGKIPAGRFDRGSAPGGGGFRTNVKTYSFEYVGT